MMRRNVESVCDQHLSQFDCPDCLLHFDETTGQYGLIVHDGGGSVVRIEFCPWCGARLGSAQSR